MVKELFVSLRPACMHSYRYFQCAFPMAHIHKDIGITTGLLHQIINFSISAEARANKRVVMQYVSTQTVSCFNGMTEMKGDV